MKTRFIKHHEDEKDDDGDNDDECAANRDGEFLVDSLNEDLPPVDGLNDVEEVM